VSFVIDPRVAAGVFARATSTRATSTRATLAVAAYVLSAAAGSRLRAFAPDPALAPEIWPERVWPELEWIRWK
jgi:hypothetical protein